MYTSHVCIFASEVVQEHSVLYLDQELDNYVLYNRSLTLQSHRMRFILHIPTTRESLYSHPVNIQIFTGEYTGEFPNI